MNKLPIGLTSALAVASVSGLMVQQQARAQLQQELANLQTQTQQLASLQEESRQLSANAAEVSRLRRDDAEIAQLQQEIGTTRAKLAEQAQARAAAAAAKRAREMETQNQLAVNPAGAPGGLDQVPRAVYQAKPVYPFEMRRAGVPGQVVVAIVVGANGEVANPVVVSSTQPEFEAAAIEAISKWKFDPGTKGGRKVNTRMEIPVVFGVAGSQVEAGPAKLQGERANEVGKWF